MCKEVEKKDYMGFHVIVERSNPLILRHFYIPSECSCDDLIAGTCIFMGIEPAEGKLFQAEAEIKDKEKALADIFHAGDEITLVLTDAAGKKKGKGLTLFARAESGPEESEKNRRYIADTIPCIDMAVGNNIPVGIWDIGELNHIQEILEAEEYYDRGDGSYYSRKELAFSEKKTENAVRRYFAPETAVKEINLKLGMPMSLLLEKLKMNELKGIADYFEVYYDSSVRKPDMIHNLCKRFGDRNIEKVFEAMTISEFQAFRRFVLSEKPAAEEKWEILLPAIYNRGLLVDVPKTGLRIASELLEYFDTWYGTEKETRFLHGKYMERAAAVTVDLYGIFLRERFLYILETSAPGIVSEEEASQWYTQWIHSFDSGISSLSNGVYYLGSIGTPEARSLYGEMYREKDAFYHPTHEEIEVLFQNSTGISTQGMKELTALVDQYTYYSYYYDYGNDAEQSCLRIIFELHKRGDIEAAVRIAENEMRRLSWSDKKDAVLAKVRTILKKEVNTLPIIALNGYSLKNCPKELLEYTEAVRAKREEAEKATGKKTQKPAVRTVKKAVKRVR